MKLMHRVSRLKHIGFRNFTLIEILLVVSILAFLMSIHLPSLKNSKDQAKFARWLAFNKHCSGDPSLVINFNFQEGKGDMLKNSAEGCDVVQNFDRRQYDGYLKSSTNATKHNFEWVASGGRWGRHAKKKALQFNGVDTYILVNGKPAVDFRPTDDFTILCWVKFDKFVLGDGIYSKSSWGSAATSAAQYDIYCDPTSGTSGKGSFEMDVFKACKGYDTKDVDLEKAGWIHLVLRYRGTTYDPDNLTSWTAECFVNGQRLKKYRATNNSTAAYDTCNSNFIIGAIGVQVSGSWTRPIWFPFQGKMDEFLMYKRGLSDGEIKGHYEMGRE